MAGGGGAAEAGVAAGITLEYTPTWIVASVCSVIVVISLLFERMLHRLGNKRLLKSSKETQYEALLKIQKELMLLLGFISLMLGVFQGATQKICVKESVMHHLLPCPLPSGHAGAKHGAAVFTGGVLGGARRLLSGGGAVDDYCLRKVFALVC
nr:MLO-like protein 1 [Setaria viridis]